MIENVKYKALKHETVHKTDPMVLLHASGVAYLKETWGLVVNKNGEKRKLKESRKETEEKFAASSLDIKAGYVQSVNNQILRLITDYYTPPDPKM